VGQKGTGGATIEHYELVTGEGDKPSEVGRAAMGVIYKAFDIDLHRVSGLRSELLKAIPTLGA
jgi:hypothetical protein